MDDEIKKYINKYFTEYHIKDCLVVLPSTGLDYLKSESRNNQNKFVIHHISKGADGLQINLNKPDIPEQIPYNQTPGNDQPDDTTDIKYLINYYMQRLVELVEISNSKPNKSNKAIWKHRNFLSSISHQIKTPISAIFSGTKLIKHYTNNDEHIDRILEYMNQSCVELTRYLNDIIDFYYLKQGVLVLEDNKIDIRDTINYVRDIYKLQIQDADIELFIEFDEQIPEIIHGDERRLTQILMNLLDNAVKFTSHPDDNISTRDKKIKIKVECPKNPGNYIPKSDMINISFLDTGLGGIDLDNQNNYFQPFNQTTRNWLNAPDGIGLGLCLSRELATLMHGDLKFIQPTFKSDMGGKNPQWTTCIQLQIPIKYLNGENIASPKLQHKHSPAKIEQEAKAVNFVLDTKNDENQSIRTQIVIIDDNLANTELLKLTLREQLGYQNIKTFTNSIIGQNYIMQNSQIISHVILDIKMPRKNGLDLLRELLPFLLSTRFILLTALNRDDVIHEFRKINNKFPLANVNLLFKPIDMTKLITLLPPMKNIHPSLKRKSTII